MSVENAKIFIKRALNDKELRDGVNSASTSEEVTAFLESKNIGFTFSELNEAHTSLLTQCQSEDDAQELKEFRMWWDMTVSMLQ